MSTVNLTYDTKRMLYGTQLQRLYRGIEHLYYMLLFSKGPGYAGKVEPWISWAEIGLGYTIRSAPPGARESDRMLVTVWNPTHSRQVNITASSSNEETTKELVELLNNVEKIRKSQSATTEDGRLEAVLKDPAISNMLVAPVERALALPGLRRTEVEAFRRTPGRAVLALTDTDITQGTVSLEESRVRV